MDDVIRRLASHGRGRSRSRDFCLRVPSHDQTDAVVGVHDDGTDRSLWPVAQHERSGKDRVLWSAHDHR